MAYPATPTAELATFRIKRGTRSAVFALFQARAFDFEPWFTHKALAGQSLLNNFRNWVIQNQPIHRNIVIRAQATKTRHDPGDLALARTSAQPLDA